MGRQLVAGYRSADPGWREKHVGFASVSCPAVRECEAVGNYQNSANAGFSYGVALTGKVWKLQHIARPRDKADNGAIDGISCATAKACIAVGATGASSNSVLAESWNGKRWVQHSAPVPRNSSGQYLDAVDCPTATACTAVGNYSTQTSSKPPGLVESSNGSKWTIKFARKIGCTRRANRASHPRAPTGAVRSERSSSPRC